MSYERPRQAYLHTGAVGTRMFGKSIGMLEAE